MKKKILDELTYGDSWNLGGGLHRQVIYYKGKEVGYLTTKETNILTPLIETYIVPDVEKGLDECDGIWRDGKKGWIEFKRFVDDYEAAFKYIKENYEQVAYLFEVGDYD